MYVDYFINKTINNDYKNRKNIKNNDFLNLVLYIFYIEIYIIYANIYICIRILPINFDTLEKINACACTIFNQFHGYIWFTHL